MKSVLRRFKNTNGLVLAAGLLALSAGAAQATQITGNPQPTFPNADALTIFIPGAPPTIIRNLGLTDAQEATCSTMLLNGCLYTIAPGVALNTNADATIIYESDGVTVADVVGIYMGELSFVTNKPGAGALDLSLLGDISGDPFGIKGTGPGGTGFILNYYLAGNADELNYLVNFVSANAFTPVPEPLTLSLFGAGLVGAATLRRRRKGAKA